MSAMRDWALFYARLGWSVFPLVPGTKSPFKGTHGSSEATTDEAIIRAWWEAHPDANIGTRPSAAGLYVYDVDPRNGGDADHLRLCEQHGPTYSPLRVNSPSGGWHLYFAAPPGQHYDGKPADGIDGKYNGYAVLPPSVHPCGRRYEWAGEVPGTAGAAPIPAWLVRPAVERKRADVPGDLTDVDKIQEALSRRDPTDYHQWTEAMASVKHWEDTGGADLAGVGYELVRQWSQGDPRHDDGAFADKWETWDSYRPQARTLGSLLHDAGMTAAQRLVDAAAVFASAPAVRQQQWWTTQPVARFKGSLEPSDVLAELHATNRFGFADHLQAHRWERVIPAVVWSVGGSCEAALQVLLASGLGDTPALRSLIAADAMNRTTWKTVYSLNAEQQQIAAMGLMAEVAVDDGKLDAALRQILATLPAIPGLFQRSNELCTVTADGRVLTLNVHSLSALLERYLRMVKGKEGTPTKSPEALVRRVMAAGEYPGVSVLKAVVNMPVARADGTILSTLGLDAATGLYLQGNQMRPPRMLTPTERDETMRRVWALFDGFPFAAPGDRSAYFAALLTTAIRPTLETAPAFLINASTAGTGKTKLAECLMLAADASKAANVWSDSPEEQQKTILGILQQAPRGVLFDNVIGAIKPTGAFCIASTSSEYTTRVLGGNAVATVENRAVWVLTGNNVWLVGDTGRRVLTVRLDSPENPERRRFPFDPVQVLSRSAVDVRLDLLDLIHTWAESGRPGADTIGGFASFEEWSRIVRPVCMWLGMVDPLVVLDESREEDPEIEKLELMMTAWEARFGDEPVYLKDLGLTPFIGEHAALWKEAENAVCTFKGNFDASRLAYWLRANKGRKFNGRYFKGEKKGPRVLWKLCKL